MRKLILILLLLLPAIGLANSGRVLFVSGKVTVERDGRLYRAVKNSRLREGDVIETAARSHLHLRMSDRTLISLKPSTRFVIEAYRYGDPEPEPGAAEAEAVQSNRSFFGLVKGGFRAITGLIGQRDRAAFRVGTPVATIGIRGTSFVAQLSTHAGPAVAAADGLMLASADAVMSDAGAGTLLAQAGGVAKPEVELTVGVGDGAVLLTNAGGTLLLENGEFGRVEGPRSAPRRLLVPPADSDAQEPPPIEEEDEDDSERDLERSDASGSEPGGESPGPAASRREPASAGLETRQVETGGSEEPAQRNSQPPAVEDSEYLLALSRKDLSVVNNLSVAGQQTQVLTIADDAIRPDANGNATTFIGRVDRDGQLVPAVIELLDGEVENPGRDLATGMQWGRWSGESLRLRFADGSNRIVDLAQAQLHFVQSASREGEITLPTTGSVRLTLRGNTDPTDNQGNLGFLGGAVLDANFDTQTVSSAIALSIGNQVWEAAGDAPLGTALSPATPPSVFAGEYSSVAVGGAPGGQGEFSGFLTEQARTAGLTYQLREGARTVNGAVAFSRSSEP